MQVLIFFLQAVLGEKIVSHEFQDSRNVRPGGMFAPERSPRSVRPGGMFAPGMFAPECLPRDISFASDLRYS